MARSDGSISLAVSGIFINIKIKLFLEHILSVVQTVRFNSMITLVTGRSEWDAFVVDHDTLGWDNFLIGGI